MKKYLFIGSHADDNELMAGGTIARLIEEGHQVDIMTLSHLYGGIDLRHEFDASMEVLKPYSCMVNSFEARMFSVNSNAILQYLFKISEFNYDFIFTHSVRCFHSDHETTAKAAIRVFKNKSILAFNQEWNSRKFIKNYFVKLEHRHVQKKLEALACYKSQINRPYFSQDVIVGSMAVNGMMAGCEFAEAFECVNILM